MSTPPAGRRFSDDRTLTTSIPAGLRIRGELSGSESVELLGTLDGPLTTEGFCHIHQSGCLRGRLSATDVLIEGELTGRVFARGKVELGASSRVKADIHAKSIAIAEGSHFDGQVHMDGGEEHVRFEEKRKRHGHRGPAHGDGPPDEK